ncbi:VanZ family protein [Ureibacillus acetophenoni]|uniref:VanZ like protein n=1 Tax=Ureibacillus acetophenoni TaxID=614649 RepID=A0A285U8C8_9BACL|nr:VanZ family protein [Ureibacillus acetophenoni]SOC38190.1 VanZ like protein [Ureibacillus acetophenoni]
MKKYLILLGVGLAILIIFSNTTYQQQTLIPSLRTLLADKPFYDLLSRIELRYWDTTISVETRGYYHFVEFLIRKSFHFIGFGLLASLFYIVFRKFKMKLAVIYAILTTFALACIDEYRQTFLAGRTGDFHDVMIDTAGAITFVILCKLMIIFREIINNRKIKSYTN